VIGSPKSAAAQRTVPFGKFVSNTLKEWKLQAKNSLVFPNTVGRIDDREKMAKHGLRAAQVAAGMGSKYPGFHCLRISSRPGASIEDSPRKSYRRG
jgi:hypothetical protein